MVSRKAHVVGTLLYAWHNSKNLFIYHSYEWKPMSGFARACLLSCTTHALQYSTYRGQLQHCIYTANKTFCFVTLFYLPLDAAILAELGWKNSQFKICLAVFLTLCFKYREAKCTCPLQECKTKPQWNRTTHLKLKTRFNTLKKTISCSSMCA